MYNIINTARIHYIQAPSVLSVSLTFSLSYAFIYILLVSLPSFPLYRVQRDARRKSRLRVRSAVYLSYAGEACEETAWSNKQPPNSFGRQVRRNTLRSANTELDRGRIFHSFRPSLATAHHLVLGKSVTFTIIVIPMEL